MSSRPLFALIVIAACVSVGAANSSDSGKGKDKKAQVLTPAGEIKAAQEQAITAMQGGAANAPITWAEKKSGLGGTLVYDPSVTMTLSCRKYRQILVLNGETLTGSLTACPQGDGDNRWKIVPSP